MPQPVVHAPIRVHHLRRSLFALSLALLLLSAARAGAYESFNTSIYAYQGIEVTSGMTEFDLTVLTVIIGDALELDTIAAPDLDPLFQFSQELDIFFSLTTDPAAPVEITALAAVGIAVLDNTAFSELDESLLASLDFNEQTASVDSDDLLALLLEDGRIVFLEHIQTHSDATIGFTSWLPEADGVPEPSMLALVAAGVLVVASIARKRR